MSANPAWRSRIVGSGQEAPDQLLAKGETRPSRLNGLEPLPRHRLPAMPKDLDPIARTAWRHAVREMGPSGIITAFDAASCASTARPGRAIGRRPSCTRRAPPLLNDRGHLTKNPLHQVVRDNADHVRLLARELGLSPAARAGLRVSPGADLPDIDAAPAGGG